MTTWRLDVDAFKAEQRAIWDATSDPWWRWHEVYEAAAGPVSERLLELGGVRPGQRVLDVATGHGEPALSAAERVGPAGHVVGLDLSPAMITLARDRARDVPNAEFVVGDMDRIDYPDASFDVLLCRFALMLSTDHVATFRELARVLVPGGVLATAVWGAHDTHLLAVGPTALGARLGMPAPPPGLPTTFSMSDPGRLTAELAEAGFTDVSVEPFEIPYRFQSVAEYVRYIREILPEPMIRLVRDVFGDADADEAWQVVARSVRPHTRSDGSVLLPSVCLCVRAVAREA